MLKRLTVSVLGCGLVLISACAPKPKTIDISITPIDKPQLVLPSADTLNLRSVDWIVVTPDNVDAIMSKLESPGGKVAIFALTDSGYKNLSLNINDLRTYIAQLQSIIVAYEGYYTETNSAIDNINSEINNSNFGSKY